MATEDEIERERRLKAMQMYDLGTERREYIFTSDKRSKYDSVSKHLIEASRAANISGTDAYNLKKENADQISAWANCANTLEQEETEDVLQFKDGQSHRARLNEIMDQDNGGDPWEQAARYGRGGRGGRGSTRARGGGVVGSRGRGGFGPSSTPTRQPLPALATSSGRGTGPILATARPIPASVMIGHHVVTRSPITTQTNASMAADHAHRARGALESHSSLQSAKTKKQPPPTRGGKLAPGGPSKADVLLDRALQLAQNLKSQNLAPGLKGLNLPPAPRPQAQGRGNLAPPPSRPQRAQSPRPPPGRTFESSLASPDDFMAAFLSRMPGDNATVPQQAKKLEVNAGPKSNANGTPGLQPEAAQATVLQVTAPTKSTTSIDSQAREALNIPRVRLPVAPPVPPQPKIVFSAKRSQPEVLVERPEIKQSPEASVLASKPNSTFWNSREAFDPESEKPDIDLIDFDQEVVQTESAPPITGAWMQQDHGLLDLDNEIIHTEPIRPKFSAIWQTGMAATETSSVMDETVDIEDEIRTLSSVLSRLTLSGEKDASKLTLGIQKTMARLMKEATAQKKEREVARSARSSGLDAPNTSDALRLARQPPKSGPSQAESGETASAKDNDGIASKASPSVSRLSQAAEFTLSSGEPPKPKLFADITTKENWKERRENKKAQEIATKLDDLKTFSKTFTFDKPIPADLTPLLGKGKTKAQPDAPRRVPASGLSVQAESNATSYKTPTVESVLDKEDRAKPSTSASQETFKEPVQSKPKTLVSQPPPSYAHMPATQPLPSQTQEPAIASSSKSEPLPPGRNLYYKAKFSPLPDEDPRKAPYTFESGLKLNPTIIGDHLLPGQGGIVDSRPAHLKPSRASAQHESSPTPAPKQFKQTRQRFETKFEPSKPEPSSTPIFGDGNLPGQRPRPQRPTNVFDSSHLAAEVASKSLDLVHRDRTKRFQAPSQEATVNAAGGSLLGERLLPGQRTSSVSVRAAGSSTNIRRPASSSTRSTPAENSSDATPLGYGEPIEKKEAGSSKASPKGALKYSASQLKNIQPPAILDSDRLGAIRRIISASMDKKAKGNSPNAEQPSSRSGSRAVPSATPVSTSRASAPVRSRIPSSGVPNIPGNAMTRQYNALGCGISRDSNNTTTTNTRSGSNTESARRMGAHVPADVGTNRRPAIFDSIYASATSAESNQSQGTDKQPNVRASATQAAPARHTSAYTTEREQYDAARVAAHRQRSARENAQTDAGLAPPADNPFASFSRPAAVPGTTNESFRKQSAATAGRSSKNGNDREFEPKTDAKKKVGGVSQSIHASQWADSYVDPNPPRRNFNNDGFMGRR